MSDMMLETNLLRRLDLERPQSGLELGVGLEVEQGLGDLELDLIWFCVTLGRGLYKGERIQLANFARRSKPFLQISTIFEVFKHRIFFVGGRD